MESEGAIADKFHGCFEGESTEFYFSLLLEILSVEKLIHLPPKSYCDLVLEPEKV